MFLREDFRLLSTHSFNDYHTKKNPTFLKIMFLTGSKFGLYCRKKKPREFTNLYFDMYWCVSNPDFCIPCPAASSTVKISFLILLFLLKPRGKISPNKTDFWKFSKYMDRLTVHWKHTCTHTYTGERKKKKKREENGREIRILLFKNSLETFLWSTQKN